MRRTAIPTHRIAGDLKWESPSALHCFDPQTASHLVSDPYVLGVIIKSSRMWVGNMLSEGLMQVTTLGEFLISSFLIHKSGLVPLITKNWSRISVRNKSWCLAQGRQQQLWASCLLHFCIYQREEHPGWGTASLCDPCLLAPPVGLWIEKTLGWSSSWFKVAFIYLLLMLEAYILQRNWS